jgi:hypothetical protein
VQDEIRQHQEVRRRLATVLGPFHLELYQVHGQLLTAYLEAGEWANALSMCYLVVGFLHLVFSSVLPVHPLLGLQLYTLGDILSQNGQSVPEGLHIYTRAREVSGVRLSYQMLFTCFCELFLTVAGPSVCCHVCPADPEGDPRPC